MTLKQFLQDKNLTAVELVRYDDTKLINVYIDGACRGLDIDTTNIPAGTSLEYHTDFSLDGDTLSVGDFSINTNNINMLEFKTI